MARKSKDTVIREAQELALAQRRLKVLHYRKLGVDYRTIGERLGISHTQAREDEMAVRAEVKVGTEATIEELRTLENDRLDMARAAIATQMLKGDLGAVDRWVKLSERTAKLNGLDKTAILNEGEEGAVYGVVVLPAKAASSADWAKDALAAQQEATAARSAALSADAGGESE